MSETKETELLFIPLPIISHLISSLQVAKLLTERDKSLTITFLIVKLALDGRISSFIKNSPDSRIKFHELPPCDESTLRELMKDRKTLTVNSIKSQKGSVRDYVSGKMESKKIAGLVIDMFCTPMMDVAEELSIPTYVFFTCNSAMLGLLFHLQKQSDDHQMNLKDYEDSDFEISVPAYVNPVPARVWPSSYFEENSFLLEIARRFRAAKGIVINSFLELERHAIGSLSEDRSLPPVYPVGPIIHVDREESEENKRKHEEIISWLDEQPDSSVIYVCFGSNGSFAEDQVKEIAIALENSGHRFLWSLRKPVPKEKVAFAGEYENPGEVLPEGFLQRTERIGKVIGWAPQMAVLGHKAVGGFVSHCGWNSTLESIWSGVPMATWPLFAEQQVNAFQLVKEFGIAVEIQMDHRREKNVIVGAEKIERAVRELMENDELRVKAKDSKEKSRMVMLEGGSSYSYLGKWLDDVMNM